MMGTDPFFMDRDRRSYPFPDPDTPFVIRSFDDPDPDRLSMITILLITVYICYKYTCIYLVLH